MKLKAILFLLIALPIVNPAQLHGQEVTKDSDLVWRWTTLEHSNHLIEATIIVDNNVVMYSVIPVCRHRRDAKCPESPFYPQFNFSLKHVPNRSFRGILKGDLEGNLWDAGGDPNAITVGVGLATKKRIALNYLYDVYFDKSQSEQIAPGFVVKTKWFQR